LGGALQFTLNWILVTAGFPDVRFQDAYRMSAMPAYGPEGDLELIEWVSLNQSFATPKLANPRSIRDHSTGAAQSSKDSENDE
jgi:hypothetical protein